jgi:hypothetical protein
MPDIISTLHNHEENGKKCAVKAKHFSNPGTMFILVLLLLFGEFDLSALLVCMARR